MRSVVKALLTMWCGAYRTSVTHTAFTEDRKIAMRDETEGDAGSSPAAPADGEIRRAGRPRLSPRAFEAAGRIRQRRQELGLTGEEIARRLDVATNCYKHWERQFGPNAEAEYLQPLAELLEVSPEWISHGSGGPAPSKEREWARRDKREALGERAKLRRLAMGASRAYLATEVPLSARTIAAWEDCWPAHKSNDIESRWEKALRVPEGWLRDLTIATPPVSHSSADITATKPQTVADEIRAIANWLAQARLSRRSVVKDELTAEDRRRAEIFASRYGVHGEDTSTLQAIGDRFGITRERIRQITETMLERAGDLGNPDTPNLDDLTNRIKAHLPASVADLDDQFRDLLGESLSLLGAERFAREVLGRKIAAFTNNPAEMVKSGEIIAIDARTHDVEQVRGVREAALRMIRSCGAAQVMFVAGAASGILNRGITPEEAIRACRTLPGFSWLKEEDGWFWFGSDTPGDNRLLSVTRKVLSVARQRVDVEDLSQAFVRNRRSYYTPDRSRPSLIEPPLSVIVAALSQTPWVHVIQHDDFQLREPLAPEETLGDIELAIYQQLAAEGGLCARRHLMQTLVETQLVKVVSLQLTLDSSPILTRLDFGLFALRGWPVLAQAVDRALSGVDGAQRLAVPDDRGWISFEFVFTSYAVQTRICGIPAYVGRAVTPGPFAVEGFSEPVHYVRTPNGHRLNRLAQKLLALGLEADDRATIRIHVEERTIAIETA